MLESHLDYLKREPYSLGHEEKRRFLTQYLQELTAHHREHCQEYARILEALGSLARLTGRWRRCPFCRCSFSRSSSF